MKKEYEPSPLQPVRHTVLVAVTDTLGTEIGGYGLVATVLSPLFPDKAESSRWDDVTLAGNSVVSSYSP
jgi:hypothetical protein